MLGNRRPSLSDVRSRWRHFWLSSHEFKTISNLKQYNNRPFISPIVSDNVLAMFWRSEIEGKYNTCDVRCLATKIDGNSILNKNTRFCCYGNRLFLELFKLWIQIIKPITKWNCHMILYLVDKIALKWTVTGGGGVYFGVNFSQNLVNFPFIYVIKFQCLNLSCCILQDTFKHFICNKYTSWCNLNSV